LVILDLFSRKAVGWAISRHIDAELALAVCVTRSRLVGHHAVASIIPTAACSNLCKDYIALLNEYGFAAGQIHIGSSYRP
jgi:hypothetical protein